jgi:NRPS condensation-like uncharacterized protein
MTTAKMYWRQAFKDYKIQKPMALPVDRKPPPNGIYTGQGFTIGIQFTNYVVQQLVDYASRFNVTLYQVCLTIYYIFLYKLTGGQQDLIVGIVQANRYRPELRRIIGMFVNTLPMLVRVDPQDTFEQLLCKVSTLLYETQPHSNLPYQDIIEQLPMKRLQEHNLIQTMFTLDEYETTLVRLDHASVIEPCSIYCFNDNVMETGVSTNAAAMFDMTLAMEYMVETHSLRAELTVSSDLFDSATAVNIATRFQLMVEQLFPPIPMVVTAIGQSIYDLSLILPEDMAEDIGYSQSISTTGTNVIGRASFAQTHIWLDEQINCASQTAINNMPFFYQVTEGSLSIERLRRALQLVVLKHSSLRTSFFFDSKADCLMQRIIQPRDDEEELFVFVESTLKRNVDLTTIMFDELCNLSNFDLSSGRVFLVYVLIQENGDKNLLEIGDFLVFNFHQSVFDTLSLDIFCRDLCKTYECEAALQSNDNELRYIDCKLDDFSLTYIFPHMHYISID